MTWWTRYKPTPGVHETEIQELSRRDNKSFQNGILELSDIYFVFNQVAYKKRATKSLNNQRDQPVSEKTFWSLFIGFEGNSKMLWK